MIGLVTLAGPLGVVGSRLMARQPLDDRLQGRPEADLLQRPVKPASGDAVVSVVGRHVVDLVMLTGQQQVPVLQLLHHQW